MNRVSSRTVVLLLLLLATVLVHQYGSLIPAARASAVWLDDEPVDPNQLDEEPEPEPEGIGAVPGVWLDDEPVDPNQSDEPPEPDPESV